MTPLLFLSTLIIGFVVAFWGGLFLILASPVIILATVGTVGVLGVVFLGLFIFRGQVRPFYRKNIEPILQRSTVYRDRAVDAKAYDAATLAAALIPGNEFDPAATAALAETSGVARTADIINRFKSGGHIVGAKSDKNTTKKNWWKFVNSVDATVYLSETEAKQFESRVEEVREARRRERKAAQNDSMSDIEEEEHGLGPGGYQIHEESSGSITIRAAKPQLIESPEVVGSAPSTYNVASADNEEEEAEYNLDESAATTMAVAGSPPLLKHL